MFAFFTLGNEGSEHLRWNGFTFIQSDHFITRNKYRDYNDALKEFGVVYHNTLLDFNKLQKYQ